jgi:murein L,D-transpeptidase YcbB/YkuD
MIRRKRAGVLFGAAGAIVSAAALIAASIPDASAQQRGLFGGLFNGGFAANQGAQQTYEESLDRQWEAEPPRGVPTLARANVEATKSAIARYSSIASQGGWPQVPMVSMRMGNSGQEVAALRRRLQMSGDFDGRGGDSFSYDLYLEAAVKRFQARHGLTPNGEIDRPTVMALNVPAGVRLQQLRTNLQRLESLTKRLPSKFVLVQIPAAQIEAVEGGQIASRHAVVVGKLDRRTPELSSTIHEINFNPHWNVPRNIVLKDLIPKAQQYQTEGRDMLADYHMDAYRGGQRVDPRTIDWFHPSSRNLDFRQKPWEENSLGFVKINFHNKHAVYIHDTPLKGLFGDNQRFHSSGCVRTQNVEQLVAWLLQSNAGWDLARVNEMKFSGEQVTVPMKKRVPVIFAYITAWATPDGNVNFRRDIYGQDGVGETASAY